MRVRGEYVVALMLYFVKNLARLRDVQARRRSACECWPADRRTGADRRVLARRDSRRGAQSLRAPLANVVDPRRAY